METFTLMRHGLYVPKDMHQEEPLSEQGQKEVQKMSSFFTQESLTFDQVFCSGKTRARQTASIIAKNTPIEESPDIYPTSDPENAMQLLQRPFSSILIVSHLPFLERFSELLGCRLAFREASAAHFQSGKLVWFLSPKQLTRN